jgi:hypothetical protein
MAYIGVSPSNGIRQKHTYTASAGQTSFSGAGAENISLSYKDSNYVDVYRNGVKLSEADYTSTSGTAIVLPSPGASENDMIEVVVYDVFSAADTVSKADGGQFDGNVVMAGTLAVTGTTALTGNATMAGTLGVTGVLTGTSLDISGDIDVDGVTNLDVVDIDGAVDMASTLGVAGVVTANAGVVVDNITIDGTEIDLSSGDLTLDVANNIILDANNGFIVAKKAGTTFGNIYESSGSLAFLPGSQDADIIFQGNDGGSTITALQLDMSDAGKATFNSTIGTPAGSASAPSHTFSSDTNTGMFKRGTDQIGFTAGGTEALAITSGGIFADTIGNKTSNGNLTIDVAGNIYLNADGSTVVFADGSLSFGQIFNTNNGDYAFYSPIQDKDIKFVGNDGGSNVDALTLDMSDGGTAIFNNDIDQPNANSYIKGSGHNVVQTDANTTYFYGGVNGVQFRTADNAAENITFSNTGATVFNEQGNDADFRVETASVANFFQIDAGNDQVRINSDDTTSNTKLRIEGNLKVSNGGQPTTGNHSQFVDNLANSYNTMFHNRSSSPANQYIVEIGFKESTPDNNGAIFIDMRDQTSRRCQIFSSGDVQNHDNSYSGFSDVKLKEQISDSSEQWDDIKALKIRKFKFKTDVATGDSDAHWRLGVIAQEVEEAGMNGLVTTNKDTEEIDGINSETGTTTKAVKYSILYMKAVKALQEAMTRIETLETKVKTLEG